MEKITIVLMSWEDAHKDQRVRKLQNHCFSDVDPKELEECWYAVGFAVVVAFAGNNAVGQVELFKREIEFDGKKILVGGCGGVCVEDSMRRKGLATKLLREGLKILKDEKCDIACLNIDTNKPYRNLYEKVGFRLMKRKVSFENVHGKIVYDAGTMFIPLQSRKIYEFLMKSKKTFHYGRGYW